MAQFYKEVEDKFYYHDGKKYIHELFVKQRMTKLLDTTQSCQRRYIDAETLLLDIQKNWFVNLIFGRRIMKHIEKYRNHKLKF